MVLPGTGTVDLPAARAGPRIMGLHHPDTPENMRFFTPPRRPEESLLWSRDIRFVNRLAQLMPSGRLLELDSGTCLIAPANELTEARAVEIARDAKVARIRPRPGRRLDRRIRPLSRRARVRGPAVGDRRARRHGPVGRGRQSQDARPLLPPPSQRRVPADRRPPVRPGPRMGVPLPAGHAAPARFDRPAGRDGHRHQPRGRARRVHRRPHPRPDRRDRRGPPGAGRSPPALRDQLHAGQPAQPQLLGRGVRRRRGRPWAQPPPDHASNAPSR